MIVTILGGYKKYLPCFLKNVKRGMENVRA